MKTILILGDALGRPCPEAGQYVKAFDPDAAEGRGHVETTPHRAEALEFTSAGAAWLCWRRTSKLRPRRPDGKPNRPMTAFTVTIS